MEVAWAVNVRSSNFPRDLGILVRLGSAELGFCGRFLLLLLVVLPFGLVVGITLEHKCSSTVPAGRSCPFGGLVGWLAVKLAARA